VYVFPQDVPLLQLQHLTDYAIENFSSSYSSGQVAGICPSRAATPTNYQWRPALTGKFFFK
jgi:hypothetical protein